MQITSLEGIGHKKALAGRAGWVILCLAHQINLDLAFAHLRS